MNRVEVKQLHQVKQLPVLVNKIEVSEFVKLSEKEFAEFIKEIEDSSLFGKLSSSDSSCKIIRREKFSRADLSNKFYEINEAVSRDKSSYDVESVLEKHKECISIIRRIGESKFREYFLFNEPVLFQDEIADKCNLSVEEVNKINDLLDEISVHNEFYFPSAIEHGLGIHYTKVASIEKDGSKGFMMKSFSPQFVRGKYKINHEKLAELKSSRVFSAEERKQVTGLIHNLELINSRKSTIYKAIQGIIEGQQSFLISGKEDDVVPFRQKDLAETANIDPGLLCRIINGRSVVTPQGKERPLKYFFPSQKKIRKSIIEKMVLSEKKSLTDDGIKERLKEEYDITISRRSIADMRKELNILSSSKRRMDKS